MYGLEPLTESATTSGDTGRGETISYSDSLVTVIVSSMLPVPVTPPKAFSDL